ncbi:MAG: TIR domain-containing protein [Anaerolineales bacterium]
MYNLFVSGDPMAWRGKPYFLEIGRCIRECEYTDTKLTRRYSELDDKAVKELQRFPCVFAYEAMHNLSPKFGVILDITKRQPQVRIEYELIDLDKFLSPQDLVDLAFDLDISAWELNRTHWAVKDVNLAKELKEKGISLPNWVRNVAKSVDITTHMFDVALSFPGEVRPFIEKIVEELEKNIGPNSYFYDNNYVSQLARPSLDTLLQDIYRKRSRLVVVFLCGGYQRKEWCGIEFRAIKEIIMERDDKKIMFVKMDDGIVDGVFKTDGYIDGRKYQPKDIARFIHERITLLT